MPVTRKLVTTHTPFLISDSRPEKVLVFDKTDDVVSVSRPDYNTLGASINKITMATFGKRETIGARAATSRACASVSNKVRQREAGHRDRGICIRWKRCC